MLENALLFPIPFKKPTLSVVEHNLLVPQN
jgi:hypothetical protein